MAARWLEATVFAKDHAVIMSGEFADVQTPMQRRKINPIGRWWKPWFYKHVEGYLQGSGGEEYIPLRHYLMRHNRSIFWVVADMIPFGNHPLFRALCGWMQFWPKSVPPRAECYASPIGRRIPKGNRSIRILKWKWR